MHNCKRHLIHHYQVRCIGVKKERLSSPKDQVRVMIYALISRCNEMGKFNMFFVKVLCVINLHSRLRREVEPSRRTETQPPKLSCAIINNNPGINKGRAMQIIKFNGRTVGIYPSLMLPLFFFPNLKRSSVFCTICFTIIIKAPR